MKFSMFIDYANMYNTTRDIYDLKTNEEIEQKIISSVNAVEDYLRYYLDDTIIKIIEKKAFVLPDKRFGKPENTLGVSGIEIIRVEDEVYKNNYKKTMNLSRKDDPYLMRTAILSLINNKIHGIIVFSNDQDFTELGQKVSKYGRYYYTAVNPGKNKKTGKNIKINPKVEKNSDVYIRIPEVLENAADGYINLNQDEIDIDEGPRVEVYKDSKLIMTYPINKAKISIGRRSVSRRVLPNIDFTDFDAERIISRQHGVISKKGDKLIYTVHENCSRGTWDALIAKRKGESFELKANSPVILGDKKGFVMVYRSI